MKSFIPHEQALINIFGHLQKCWDYTPPTGVAAEAAICRGLQPYYPNVRSLGGSGTVVDVGCDDTGLDIKAAGQISFPNKLTKSSNHNDFHYVQVLLDGQKINVKIPRHHLCITRRPSVDLKDFRRDPSLVIKEAINDTLDFAFKTTVACGLKDLVSVVVYYGSNTDDTIRALFISFAPHAVPTDVDCQRQFAKDKKTPNGYLAFDKSGNKAYKLTRFNRGSANFEKIYYTLEGNLCVYSVDKKIDSVYTHKNTLGTFLPV